MSELNRLLEQMELQIIQLEKRIENLERSEYSRLNMLHLTDGIDAPSAVSGWAIIYVDISGGDLKIKFEDNVTKTIITDT